MCRPAMLEADVDAVGQEPLAFSVREYLIAYRETIVE